MTASIHRTEPAAFPPESEPTPGEAASAALALLPEVLAPNMLAATLLALGQVNSTCRALTLPAVRARVRARCAPAWTAPDGARLRAVCARQDRAALGPKLSGSAFTEMGPPDASLFAQSIGRRSRPAWTGLVSAVASAGDGLRIAIGTDHGEVSLWRVTAPREPEGRWGESDGSPVLALAWTAGDVSLAWLAPDAVGVVTLAAEGGPRPQRVASPGLSGWHRALRPAGQMLRGVDHLGRRWSVACPNPDAGAGDATMQLMWQDASPEHPATMQHACERLRAAAAWLGSVRGTLRLPESTAEVPVAVGDGHFFALYGRGWGDASEIVYHGDDGAPLWRSAFSTKRWTPTALHWHAGSGCLVISGVTERYSAVMRITQGRPAAAWHLEGRVLDISPCGGRVLTTRASQGGIASTHAGSSRLDEPLNSVIVQLFDLHRCRGQIFDYYLRSGQGGRVSGGFTADGTRAVFAYRGRGVVVDLARPMWAWGRYLQYGLFIAASMRSPHEGGCEALDMATSRIA